MDCVVLGVTKSRTPLTCFHFRFIWWLSGKESACQAGDVGSIPALGRSPWGRKWQSTPVFLPEKSHG